MGSFNTSCFVTHQTIAPRNECVIVAIRQQATYQPVELTYRGTTASHYGATYSTCYPVAFWEPVSPFFEATYNDYGRVLLADTPLNRGKLRDFIKDALAYTPVVSQGENQFHDVPYDLRAFMQEKTPQLLVAITEDKVFNADTFPFEQGVACWDYIYEVAQEQRMFWRDIQGKLRPMSYSIMHKAAWTELIGLMESYSTYRGESYALQSFLPRILEGFKAKVERCKVTVTPEMTEKEKEAAKTLHSIRLLDLLEQAYEPIRRMAGESIHDHEIEVVATVRALTEFLAGTLDETALCEELRPWLAPYYACAALEALNLHFEPIVYASQDYGNEIGTAYLRLVSKVETTLSMVHLENNWGEVSQLSICAKSTEAFEHFAKHAADEDVSLLQGKVEADADYPGFLRIHFACSHEQEVLSTCFNTYAEPTPGSINKDSLRQELKA